MAVNLKQIALHVGVSVPTVSDVLGKRGHIYRPETRRRVIEAAQLLGYRPNSSAQAMRRGRFGCAALLLSTEPHRSSLFSGLLNAIHDALMEHDLHLTIARLPDENLTNEGYVPKILQQWMVDGLLINYNAHIPKRMIELIQEYSIPSIWINSKRPSDGVHPDDVDAGRRATEHLLTLGHSRVAYVDYSHDVSRVDEHYSALDRQEGYRQAMCLAGLTPSIIRHQSALPRDQRVDFTLGWLTRSGRPTAVVAYSKTTALPIIHAATVQVGLDIPSDLSVVTFSERLVDDSGLPIDTFILPEHEMGHAAVQMLLRKIDKPGVALSSTTRHFGFERGRSSAPPRSS